MSSALIVTILQSSKHFPQLWLTELPSASVSVDLTGSPIIEQGKEGLSLLSPSQLEAYLDDLACLLEKGYKPEKSIMDQLVLLWIDSERGSLIDEFMQYFRVIESGKYLIAEADNVA